MNTNKDCTIILNWNSTNDTIGCIDSVLASSPGRKIVIALDNNSDDDFIRVCYQYYINKGVEAVTLIEDNLDEKNDLVQKMLAKSNSSYLILIKNKANYGFAGGVNIGIKYALNFIKPEYVWLLNNDARADHNALELMEELADSDCRIGFVGSMIKSIDAPHSVICIGGATYYPYLCRSRLWRRPKDIRDFRCNNNFRLSYLSGASLLFRSEVVEQVGLMDETFFLYAEEKDWQLRAKNHGWKIAIAKGSCVYHKLGGTTKRGKGIYYFYNIAKSGILFTRKHYNFFILIIALIMLIITYSFQNANNFTAIRCILLGAFDGLKKDISLSAVEVRETHEQ